MLEAISCHLTRMQTPPGHHLYYIWYNKSRETYYNGNWADRPVSIFELQSLIPARHSFLEKSEFE
jgi:hypothetical protein